MTMKHSGTASRSRHSVKKPREDISQIVTSIAVGPIIYGNDKKMECVGS